MNKFFKWLLAVLGVFVLLVVISAVVLPLVFDPNNYKEEIQNAVKEETGRELRIGGDIAWSFFPWLGFEVNDITLGNRQGFGDEPMLKVGQAGASVKIMPLFSKQVEIGKVTFTDMAVQLTRKANGENNWEDLTDAKTGDISPSEGGKNDDIRSVKVSGIEINNASIRWDDAGQVTELSNARLTASGIANSEPFDLEGGFSISLADPALKGDLKFSGHVIPTTVGSPSQIKGLTLGFSGRQGIAPHGLAVNFDINANAVLNENSDSLTLNNFEFDLYNMNLSGDIEVNAISNTPTFRGVLQIAEFNPKTLMKNLGLDAPVTSNPDAMTKLDGQISLTGSANEANIQDLNIRLDSSRFAGRFRARNFSKPDLDFDLGIDSLNLDDYLPPDDGRGNTDTNKPGGAPAKGPANSGGSRASDNDLNADVFRGYTGGGKFKIGELVISGLTATNVTTVMSADSNGLRFYPSTADFYGGKNQSDIRLDATGERPILIIKEELSGVQADGLLQDLTGKASRLLGTGSLSLNLRTDLSNSRSARETLSGDLNLNVLDGALVGIDVAKTISQVQNLLGKQDESEASLDDQAKTEFANLGLSGLIQNGILSSDDFAMNSTLLRATGKGQINLVNETIDYLVKPVLSENVRGQGRSTLGKLSGVPIPIKVSGSLYEPKISIDIVSALTASQKDKIEEKKTELTNKLFSKLLGDDDEEEEPNEGQSKDADAGDGSAAESDTDSESQTGDDEQDPAEALINSLFGSKKDKKKKKMEQESESQTDNDGDETGT